MKPIKAYVLAWFIIGSLNLTTIVAQEASSSSMRTMQLYIYQQGNKRPINKAEITIDDKSYYTDQAGRVTIAISPTSGALTIYRAGYENKTIPAKTFRNQTQLNIYLTPAQPDDSIIVIKGEANEEVSTKNISLEESLAVGSRGDPLQVTKLLPGVQTPVFGTQLIVRGSRPRDSRYYLDTFVLPFIYHSIGGISVVPKQIISDINFNAGGFSPESGEATGGVIRVDTTTTIPKKQTLNTTLNLPIFAAAYLDQPLSSKTSFSASARVSYVDVLLKKILKNDSLLVLPSFADAHLQYIHKDLSQTDKVTLLFSQDGLKLAFPSMNASEDGNLEFNISTRFALLGYERKDKLGKDWKYTLSPHIIYTYVENKFADSYIDIKGPSYRLPVRFEKRLSRTRRFFIGTEAQIDRIAVEVKAPRIASDDPFVDFEGETIFSKSQYTEYLYSLWVGIDQDFGPITFTPGFRASYATQLKDSIVDPRFKIRIKLNPKHTLKFGFGQYSKSPRPQETDNEFGNSDLTFEKSYHYIAGWKTDWSQRWSTDIQTYYKSNRDVVRSDTLDRYLNNGQQRSVGFEVFLRRKRTNRAFGWLSYTYSKTEEKKVGDLSWQPFQFDQTHVVNLTGNYKFSGKWSLGARINYHSGDRFTPVSHAVYNTNLGKYQPRYDKNSRYAKRLPDYYQLDLYTVYDFLFKNWTLKLRGGVEYIAFTRPAFGVTYNYDYSKEEYLKGLYPLPYIELQGEF